MRLLLIRHAESRGNLHRQWQGWLDEPLTARGCEQATKLAERLHRWSIDGSEPISAVYGSTLARAFQTAGILAQRWAVPLVLDSRLRERDVGVMQGLTWPEVETRYPDIAQTIRQRRTTPHIPGGESTLDLTERVWNAVEEIVARSNGLGGQVSVAVVSHGGAINAYFNKLIGRDDEMPFMFRFGNSSLSIVEIQDDLPRISLVNDMCHLE